MQMLIFRMLRNNADVPRCSYFELGVPVVKQQITSMIFPLLLLVSKTDKQLGDDTFQNQSVKPHLVTDNINNRQITDFLYY